MRKLWIIFFSIIAAVPAAAQAQERGPIVRIDSALDAIVPPEAKVEKLAGNIGFGEGPVWVRKGGYLIFSDIPANVIDKWNPKDGKVTVFLEHSGFTGENPWGAAPPQGALALPGSNGITLDPQGRVVFCQHGDRQIVRLEKDGQRTVIASHYEAKRLNSPNDIVSKSNGSVYFTDPPAGLREGEKDPKKELPFNGVYMVKGGKLQLLTKDVARPNGLAFTPDEKHLYVNEMANRTIMRFDVQPDDTITNGRVFFDINSEKEPGVPDGLKVDQKGNVYCACPGGVWIVSPEGKPLGTIVLPERPANLAFGEADGKALFVTARTGLYRIRLKIPGIRP